MFSIAKKRFISIHLPLRKARINIENTSNPNWAMPQSGQNTELHTIHTDVPVLVLM